MAFELPIAAADSFPAEPADEWPTFVSEPAANGPAFGISLGCLGGTLGWALVLLALSS